jgi:hypothetical protein
MKGTMNAVSQNELGGPEVLKLVNLPIRLIGGAVRRSSKSPGYNRTARHSPG